LAIPFHPDHAPVVLPRGPHKLERQVVLDSQRGRLLAAFVDLVAERGTYAVPIGDIVKRAGTAKRTFYEHFRTREECMLQAFDVASGLVVSQVIERADAEPDPIARIAVGTRAYLEALGSVPQFTEVFLRHMRGGGPELADRWAEWVEAVAGVIVQWRADSRAEHAELPPLTRVQAMAAISAINEVVQLTVLREGLGGIATVTDELIAITAAILTVDSTRT
jgi:AcrR family transcriptional regulator